MPSDLFPKPRVDYVLPPDLERAIEKKAEELYEKRIAPYAKDVPSSQRQKLIDFQKLVFVIDHYGEHVEKLDPAVLDSLWKKTEEFLNDLEIEKSLQVALLQDVKNYAQIEASTRTGKKLTDYEIGFFYFKKSCDVRMQRHIMRYLNKQPASSSRIEITRDILEEIEDDVDDLEEDKSTPFNGNRLLEILKSKYTAKLDEYTTFINSLPNAPQDLVQRIIEKINKLKY